ncbi:MAG TPA: DUF1178 family protein [Xanthobacteraceae bacterium]|nr:DUF1178 family protein [Xanthobacteraceae bacterium]
MIRYTLVCDKSHQFESWFQNAAAYDKQAARGLVACPLCNSTKVEKAIMAPALGRSAKKRGGDVAPIQSNDSPPENKQTAASSSEKPVAVMSEPERELRTKLKELRDHLTKNADYVGKQFPDEARRMHYGEIEHRSIYGEASPDDAAALSEEGIAFQPLPLLPDDHN